MKMTAHTVRWPSIATFHIMHAFRSTFQIRGLRYRPIIASPTTQPGGSRTATIHNLLLQEPQLSKSTTSHNRNIITMYINTAQDAPLLTHCTICLYTSQRTPTLIELLKRNTHITSTQLQHSCQHLKMKKRDPTIWESELHLGGIQE